MDILEFINTVGFPIFACIYLGRTNSKILYTIDKRLHVLEIKIDRLENSKNE